MFGAVVRVGVARGLEGEELFEGLLLAAEEGVFVAGEFAEGVGARDGVFEAAADEGGVGAAGDMIVVVAGVGALAEEAKLDEVGAAESPGGGEDAVEIEEFQGALGVELVQKL